MGFRSYPPPLVYYSDNGAGQTANMLDNEVMGLFARLNIEHLTGIPGNPMGRGRIERLWQTTLIAVGKNVWDFLGARC
ncbi:hypothetical protein [Kingella kingae]|uniref:hypothetical protein n=1 Tax=Kingella kingae TaxID=504 RepID=UPI0012BB7928|nr:hypothetical protein [Kingella kingae]